MKKFKKIMAVVAAMSMATIMSFSAAAATVTIVPNPDDKTTSDTRPTYTYYEMFKATVGSNGSVSYYVEDETKAKAIDGLSVDNNDMFTVTKASGANRWNITLNKKGDKNFTGEEIAKALDAIKSNAIDSGTAAEKDGKLVIDTGDSDYYIVVESSLGTVLSADTTNTNEIKEKNVYPTVTKEENKQNAEIGEAITYTVPVVIPANVANKEIKVVDTMTKGLTPVMTEDGKTFKLNASYDNTSVTTITSTFVSGDNDATVITMTIPADVVTAAAGKTITLTYKATINEDAVVKEDNVNKVHIVYDNYTSVDVEVKAKTFGFELKKVDANNHDTKLQGVTFTLANEAGEYYTLPTDDNNKDEDRFVTVDQNATAPKVATDENGKISFAGLHAGKYTLTEISTLNGYNLLPEAIVITIDDKGDATTTKGSVQNNVLLVENNQGSALPSTGGMGTTILYVAGAILVIAGAAVLVIKKRHEA